MISTEDKGGISNILTEIVGKHNKNERVHRRINPPPPTIFPILGEHWPDFDKEIMVNGLAEHLALEL